MASASSRGRWRRILILPALLLAAPAIADFGDYLDHSQSGQTLEITTTAGLLSITALNAGTFSVHYAETGVRQLPSFAVAGAPAASATVVADDDDDVVFAVDGLTVVASKSPVSLRFLQDGKLLVAEEHGYFAYETVRGFRFALDDNEKLLGGGQRVLGMNRRGKRIPLYNRASYGYTTEAEQMYYSLPAVLSSDRYIIAFDNTARGWLDIASTEENVLQFEAVGGRTAYIVSAGGSYPKLIERFTDATGRQPLPPRWAFGNYASRFGYRSEQETRDVVRRFREADIPLDAVILDLYWFGPEIRGYMGNLDWDRMAFPTPEKMIADFLADGIRTIPITEPFVLSASDAWPDAVASDALATRAGGGPKTFNFYFGNTGLIDVFSESGRRWFWLRYERLFDQAVGGTWGDLGEPEVHPADALHRLDDTGLLATADEVHNAYGHRWAQMVFENQLEKHPETRPVVLMRAGFVGSQRYGMMPWTGDVSRSWGGLKPQVELALQMSVFGLAYTHSDLGGFAGGEKFDRELYLRWLQYGVFQPVYRPHAQEHIPPEPVFHDRKTRRIARDFIRLRYALLPYIYTLAWENTTTGMPLMRPLFFEDEADPELIEEKDTFLWGNAFLVEPVTEAGARSVDVRLPGGVWFDFWDDTRYEGNKTVAVPVSLETTPVLVRAGSFIPMADVVDSTERYSSEHIILQYYADESVRSSSGRMYDDDGRSRESLANGEFELLMFESRHADGRLTIDLSRAAGHYEGMPERRDITLVVHNLHKPAETVTVNGNDLPLSRDMPEDGAAASYDRRTATLTVRFNMHHPNVAIAINE